MSKENNHIKVTSPVTVIQTSFGVLTTRGNLNAKLYQMASDVRCAHYSIFDAFYFTCSNIKEDVVFGVLIVKTKTGSDVWNYYTGRSDFQKVYSLPYYKPEEQALNTKASIQRLFETE